MSYSNIFSRAISSLIGAGAVICAAVFAAGCTEGLEETEVQDNVTMSLRLDEAFQEKAYVRVNHDGDPGDVWYYAVTEDLESAADSLLKGEISAAINADGYLLGNVGTNKSITIDSLSANSLYRVIAARVLTDGSITGNVAELVFKTLRDLDVFEEHPSWRIEYKERRVSKDNPDEESEIFSCTIGDSKDTYVPCLLSKNDFKNSYGENLRSCFEDYVAFRNQNNVKWHNVVLAEDCEHVEDRLRSGDYMVFMVGIDSLGVLTGYYAKEEFAITQDPATEAYRAWLGNWTLKGMAGDEEVEYPVYIKPDENNLYYRMFGYEHATSSQGFEGMTAIPGEDDDERNYLSILLYFSKSTGDIYVVSEEHAAIPDYAGIYYFYLYGCIEIDYNGTMTDVPVDMPNMRLARFTLNSAKNRATASPEPFILDVGGVHYDTEFKYFNFSYIFPAVYQGLVPVTLDSAVPKISTLVLEK